MPILKRRRVILAKTETEYGSDATPTAATDAMLVEAGSSLSVDADVVERNPVRATMSPLGHVVASKAISISVTWECRGSGTAGTPPEVDALLQSCALASTVEVDTSVTYAPVSTPASHKSCTIYWYEDGLLHKAVGCRGTVSINMAANGIPKMDFSMQGIYVAPVDATLPSPTLGTTIPPVVNDAGMTIGSYTPVATSFELSLANQVEKRMDINAADGVAGYTIVDRKPTGSVDPEAELLETFDPWTAWQNGTTAALSATAGSTAGNITTVSVSAAQYQTPGYSDRNGLRTYSLPFVCTGDNDNELYIVFT
jgi:hypothetical protein